MKKKIIADAIITREKGVALGVVTADCVPILLFDYENKIVGCIHAGWKGAFSGILKKTIDIFGETKTTNLSLHTYEEEKLITLFDPKWNTVGRKK